MCFVIDSGATWNCHPYEEDLINKRPTNDTVSGVTGGDCKITCIGDLPALARDHKGTLRKIIIRNVRCVPAFEDSLISVKQIFKESGANAEFADKCCVTIRQTKGDRGKQRNLSFPFIDGDDDLYEWSVFATATNSVDMLPKQGIALASKGSTASQAEDEMEEDDFDVAKYKRPTSKSFIHAMSGNAALTER